MPGLFSEELHFWDHISELRKRLIHALLGVAVTSSVGLYYADLIMKWLTKPFRDSGIANGHLSVLSPVEAFNVYIMVGIWGGVIIALPWVFYQLWRFVAPGLYKKERRTVIYLVFASTFFFLGGVAFCWWLLPRGIAFLASFSIGNSEVFWSLDKYLSFVVFMALAFGICFQLPLVMAVLIRLGLVKPKTFRESRRFAYVAIAVLSAAVTPTTDMFTMSAMMIPLIILYEISIVFGAMWQRKAQKKDQETVLYG